MMATFGSVLFSVFVYLKEAEDRQSDAIARAWSLLTTPAVGNSGKIEALEYLYSQNIPLTGIDLSCATMGGAENWDAEKHECETPTFLRRVNLAAKNDRWVDLSGAHLQGADLTGANLRRANLFAADLQGTNLWNANLQGADLRTANLQKADLRFINLQGTNLSAANLPGASLWGANLQGAYLKVGQMQEANLGLANLQGADLGIANLQAANVSKADFTDAQDLNTADFTGAWAWADQPPIGIDPQDHGISLCVYDHAKHDRWEKPDPCIPPQGSGGP
ncbi:MAG: pentapeptide repeat-containing protein [Planktomarina sp.]